MATSPRSGGAVRVSGTGLRYRTPAEAFADADEIETQAEAEAEGLRASGKEAAAERAHDRASELARRIRAAARAVEARAAASTPQPRDVPKRRSSGTAKRSGPAKSRRPAPILRPARRDVERFAERSGLDTYTGGAAELAWTAVGVIVGLSLLFVLLNERGRGPAAVAGIVGAGSSAFARFLDPRDPLLLGARPGQPAAARTTSPPPRPDDRAVAPRPSPVRPR